jgi:hypothetical protein
MEAHQLQKLRCSTSPLSGGTSATLVDGPKAELPKKTGASVQVSLLRSKQQCSHTVLRYGLASNFHVFEKKMVLASMGKN